MAYDDLNDSLAVLPPVSRRGVTMFLAANVIAAVLCATVFGLFWYADALNAVFAPAWHWMSAHSTYTTAAAISPLPAAALVGYGYMRRAMKRRQREKEDAMRAALEPDPESR